MPSRLLSLRHLGFCAAVLAITLVPAASPAAKRAAAKRRRPPLPLARAIPALLAQSGLAQAHWGISVVTMSGKSIYGYNDSQYFHPASNAKLFTTAAVFALLPQQLTFTTNVVTAAPPNAAGEVRGDVAILGVGDANISGRTLPYDGRTERPNPPLAALEDMADQIVRRGVHTIDGKIIGDDTWFVYERYGSGWSWDDLQWSYGAPISALTVNDNTVYLNVMPGAAAGEPALASWLPSTAYYTLENAVTTSAGGAQEAGIERAPGSLSVRIYGQTPLGGDGIHEALAIEDPADYAARSLREMLLARGVRVIGGSEARHRSLATFTGFAQEQFEPLALQPVSLATVSAPYQGTLLASHVSPPLSEDLTVTNKVSQNLHAEIMLRTLGKLLGTDGSLEEGTRVLRQFMIGAGVAPGDFMLYDGSGLSPMDLVTPRAFTSLLVYAAGQSWGESFRATLPVGGMDGTLASRFRKAPLAGKVVAKSGTLAETTALAGYVTGAKGDTVAFSIVCGDHMAGGESERDTVDKIVAAIAAVN